MSETDPHLPEHENPEPLELEDSADVGPRDSEIDFDDEQQDEIGPLDEKEAREAGALLDDPESLPDPDGDD
ncbi:MAG: hypothetical protein JWM85_3587 [Acidimicrobiaceae bacterium]|nr:hypothetical protein [Acidimicrobiaceae bacterium]